MSPHDGRVDHHPERALAGGLGDHLGEEFLQPTGEDPPSEPGIDGIPGPELLGQVPPGLAGASDVEDGLEEHPLGQVGLRTIGRLATFDHRPHDLPDLVGDDVPHGATDGEAESKMVKPYVTSYQATIPSVNTP